MLFSSRRLRARFCASAAALGLLAVAPAFAQITPYKVAEAELAIDGLSAHIEGVAPVVPRNVGSGLRVVVRAGGADLTAEEAALFLGSGFEVRAELAGPGLRTVVSLPLADEPLQEDPLLLRLPGLTVAGDYTLSGLRIAAGGRTLLDVAPRQVQLRVIEQILITSVQTRPLTMAELQDKGVLIDAESYLGFEFTIGLLLESEVREFRMPVTFNRQGVPQPPVIPLPPAIRREGSPLIVPLLFEVGEGEGAGDDGGGGGGGGGGDGFGGQVIPSVLVIPGSVGHLKKHFAAQLFVSNGAPAGSNLRVRDVIATIHLPTGSDPGPADDPLILAPLVDRTPSPILPVRGLGSDGAPGTADDVEVLGPGAMGQAEFLLRGELEGFHNISFDLTAVLEGLPTGPAEVTSHGKGGVLVRNGRFDMAFTVPNVVRTDERFKVVATISNIGRGHADDLSVTINQAQMSGLVLHCATPPCDGTIRIPHLAAGDARSVVFEFKSQRTGQVVASYLHFDTGGSGRLNFTIGVGERGVPLSPDTLVLPTSVEGLPPDVAAAAMRVLGQAWSVANAPPERLLSSVQRIPRDEVVKKLLALAEAGLRVDLGQPPADAVRDLALDFYGGEALATGFDQLLRETEAGRNLAYALGAALEAAAGAAGGPAAYERRVSEVAAAGPAFAALSVRGTGGPVGVVLSDAAGRRTVLGRSTADDELALSEIPGAAFLPLGAPASAPSFGLLTAPTQAPYFLTVTGAAEVSATFPRGDGTYRRGTITTQHPARIAMDSGALSAVEDVDGDGTYETPRSLVGETLASQGPRLLSATILGPETLRGASVYGTNLALLFDRMVDEESAAEKSRYQIPNNEPMSAKRQLSGRLVFLGLAQPEGNYVPTTVSVAGLPDTRGVVGPAGTVPLTSRLTAPGAVVSGHVVNADGTPFTGGLVYYSQYSTEHRGCTDVILKVVSAVRPDSSGRYELRYVPRDPCGFPFEMAVYDPVTGGKRSVTLYGRTAGEQIVADLALMGRGTVTGVIRDAAGQTVGGALVVAYSVTDALVAGHHTTGGDGRYTIPNITVGGVNVRAVRGIHVGQAAGRIDRAGGTATVDVRLEGGSARISGRVFKQEDGETTPLPGVYVQYRLSSDTSYTLLGVAVTDGTGRYALEGMPAGNFSLRANLNTRDAAQVLGHADEGQVLGDMDLVIVVPPEAQFGSVRGTVRFNDGTPAGGVLVNVSSRATLSASDGTYEITGLPVPSNPTIQASTRDGLRVGVAYAFLTASNPRPTGIDVTLSGDGNAELTVLDPTGQPVAGQTVLLDGSCSNSCGCISRVSDAQGRVRFEGLRLGTSRVARALRFVDGVQDVAHASVYIERAGQTIVRELRFGGAGTVRGVVREHGTANPIHGAVVSLRSPRFLRNDVTCGLVPQAAHQMRTDVQGRFEFTGVNVGGVRAAAYQEFFGTTNMGSDSGTLVRGQDLSLSISLRNTMAGGLSGTVFLPDGETPAGPGVEVTVNGMLPDVTVLTNGEGHYEFAEILPEGRYTMTARDPISGGVARQLIHLRAQQDAVHDVRLLGEGTVEVTVVDGGDELVDAASVRLRQTEYPFRTYDGVVQPVNQGVVRFERVVEGPFTVEAWDVYGRGGRGSGEVTRPGETTGVRVRLTVTGVVRGHFRMPDDTPIPFGTVRLTSAGRAIGQVTTAGSGDVGSFAFDYVPGGPVRLDAEDPATARTGLAVGTIESEDQELTLDVRAQALGTVRGRVTGDGTPQPGALVQIVSGTYRVNTAADGDGWYEVPGIPEGRITVTASLDGGYLRATVSGTLAGEGSTLQLDVALRPSGEVRGTVTRAVGETPARAAVSVRPFGGSFFTHHTTEDGRFDFTRVAAGPATLRADELGTIDRAEASAVVPEGGVVDVPMRLNGVGSLRGRALASDGVTPTGGYLALAGTSPRWDFWVRLGPDGLFHLPEVLAGPVTARLQVVAGGFTLYGTASATIVADQETVLDVRLQDSGTVTGVVLRAGGAPAFGATVSLLHERGTVHTQALADGRFTFRGVPLGAFTLVVHDEATAGRAKVRNLQIASNGQTVDLGTFELDAVPPTLTVIDPTDGSSRPPLGGTVVVDVADAQSGVDTSTFEVVYASGSRQRVSEFTIEGGRVTGRLRAEHQVVGSNVLRFEVQDLAGNLTQQIVTYTATGATLQGHVRQHDGTPVPQALVTVNTSQATADAAGAYVRGGLLRGGAWVTATDPTTGMSTRENVHIFDGETRTVDLVLPAFGFINGVVRRASGTPVPGAIITCTSCSTARSVTAGEGGAFNMGAFSVGPHHLTATEPARGDRGTSAVTLSLPGQTVTTEIRLNGVGTVTATVRNADGTPVTGALVRAVSSAVLGWNGAEQPTPANGTVSWSQALAGTITVTARDTQRNLAGQASGALADNGNLALTVTLEPAGSVVGTVYRAGGTAVAAGVDVTISGAANRTVRTDEQGRYAIPDVRMAAFQLLATDPASGDQGRASGVVSSTSPVTADITLAGVRAVRVLVHKASGDPAPGAQVTIGTSADIFKTYTGTAGADGTVTIENVLAGTITLRADLWSSFSTGQATATLTPGVQPFEVTLTLEPVGTIRGRVFAPDAVTPAAGVTLRIGVNFLGMGRGAYATSAADGSYEFSELPLRTGYEIFALVAGRTRARNPGLSLTSPGQVLVHDVVLVGVGTVSGVVTDPAGAPVAGAAIKLQISSGHYQGSFNTSSGTGGVYSLAGIPVGPFTITASRPGQSVNRVAEISQDGEALTIDLQLLSSFVTLEHALTDGNSLTWRVQVDGSVHGAYVVWNPERGAKLTVFESGTPRPFTGAGTQAATEEDKREVVIRQDGLAGLTVTRKAFVPATGYFLRYLDVLENPGSTPITVDVAWESQHSFNTRVPSVVDSASGDATPGPDDGWLLLDDAETQDIYDATHAQFAPLGVVLAGPNGLPPSAVTWDAATHRLTYRWNGVTVAPGQKAAFLHLMTAQADRARGRASAVRLAQIPSEVLVGLTPDEAGAVRNFLVPVDLASNVEALPPMDGVVNGKLFGGDGQTPIAERVRVRSRSPHYGRPFDSGYDSGPDGSFELYGVLSGSVKVLPRTDFDLTSTHMSFVPNTGQTTTVPGRFPDAEIRNLADLTGRSVIASSHHVQHPPALAIDGLPSTRWRVADGDSAEPPYNRTPFLEVVLPGEATIHEVRVRCSLASPLHLIRRARVQVKGAGGAVLWSADVDLPSETGAADVPVSPAVAGARSVRVTSLADGTYPSIAEIEIMGEGIPGPSRLAQQDLLFTGRGVLEGRVLRSDQTPLGGFKVTATSGGLDEWVTAAADGSYRFHVVPPGTYSVKAEPPTGGYSTTVPGVVVAPDQKTTQDVVFPSMGGLSGRTLSAANQLVNASLRLEGPGGLVRNASGPNFTFPDLPPGAYTLKATHLTSQGAVSLPVTITADTVTTQDMTFPPVGSVVVTATVDGSPLYDAYVQWRSAASPVWGGHLYTNGSGQVTLSNVMGPSFTIRVTNPANPHAIGEASGEMPAEGATVPVSVAVPGLGSVTGTVLSQNGVAQANVTVRIYHATEETQYASVTANASGVFNFNNNVPAMPFRLRSELSGGIFDKAEIPGALTGPTLQLDGLVPRGVLTAARPAALWEYTLDQGDSGEIQALRHALGADPALADPRLEVYGPDGTLVAANDDRSPSNNDPLVQFTAPQAGTYLAVVKATGTGGYRLGSGLNARVFRPYQGVAVTGHVVREGSGTPVAGGIVRVAAARAGGLSVTAYATTQPDGSFQFPLLPAGATVTADLLEGGVAVAGAAGSTGAQGTTLDLTLTRPGLGQVEVRTTYRGAPWPGVPVELVSTNAVAPAALTARSGVTGPDGRWVVVPVPAGTITARATDPLGGGSLEAAGTLSDGGTLTLELALSDGGDNTPPEAVGNLSGSAVGWGGVQLSWTAPGDDGASGTAAAYDLRYSTSPITEASFGSATVAPTPTPAAGGTSQTFDLSGLPPNTALYFALKARDEVHNWSALSNVAQVSTGGLSTAGLKLWLKSDTGVVLAGGTNYVTTWQDQSGTNNHTTQATAASQPLLVAGEVNGLPVLRFDGTNDWLSFATRLTTIRTVFWVVRENPAAGNGYRYLLGDAGTANFASDGTHKIWLAGSTSASVLGGDTRLNGALINGTTTNRPTTMAVISVVTTGPVTADSFSRYSTLGRYWFGDLAELVIYDRVLGDLERAAIESYLARKYAIYAPPLPAPVISPNGGTIAGTTTVTIQAQDAEEIWYTLDGTEPTASSLLYTEPLAVSGRTTLKAKSFASGFSPSPTTTVTFLASADFSPASVSGLRLWVRADAGVAGSASERVGSWADQSGATNHLTQPDLFKGPLVTPNLAGGLPALTFDGTNDWLAFTGAIANVRTVLWVVRANPAAPPGYRYLLGDSSGYPWSSGSSRQIWSSSYTNPNIRNGQTRVNGALVNGTTTDRPTALSVVSVVTTGNVPAANFARDPGSSFYGWWGELAELVIYDAALSEADRRAVEEYLAARYGITLP